MIYSLLQRLLRILFDRIHMLITDAFRHATPDSASWIMDIAGLTGHHMVVTVNYCLSGRGPYVEPYAIPAQIVRFFPGMRTALFPVII